MDSGLVRQFQGVVRFETIAFASVVRLAPVQRSATGQDDGRCKTDRATLRPRALLTARGAPPRSRSRGDSNLSRRFQAIGADR